jgi:hypothetical protein
MEEVKMANSCSCGCSTMTVVTNAEEACECGCACCAEEPRGKEQEVLELLTLKARINERLRELEPARAEG